MDHKQYKAFFTIGSIILWNLNNLNDYSIFRNQIYVPLKKGTFYLLKIDNFFNPDKTV